MKNPQGLFTKTGSSYLTKRVSEAAELAEYYDIDKLDASGVRVLDWLLAEAVPGVSFAAGANRNNKLKTRNFDMSTSVGSGSPNYFMTYGENLKWPLTEEDKNVWHHSSYKKLCYQNVYRLYDKFVEIICE